MLIERGRTKGHRAYLSNYMKYPKEANMQREKEDRWVPESLGREKLEVTTWTIGSSFSRRKDFTAE